MNGNAIKDMETGRARMLRHDGLIARVPDTNGRVRRSKAHGYAGVKNPVTPLGKFLVKERRRRAAWRSAEFIFG